MFLSGPASAQEKRSPVKLFNQASDLAAEGKLDKAVSIWLDIEDELPLKHQPKLQLALGLSFAVLKKYPEAWHHLTIHLALAAKPEAKALAELKRVGKELSSTHVKVELICVPAGGKVSPGAGGPLRMYRCPLTWWYEPGSYKVMVREVEGRVSKHPIEVPADRRVVSLTLEAPKDKPVPKDKPSIFQPGFEEEETNWVAWSAVGGGLLMAAGGGVMHYLAHSSNEDLHDDYKGLSKTEYNDKYGPAYDDEVRPKLWASYVLYGVGAAAVGVGTAMLLLEGTETGPGKTGVSGVAPLLSPDCVGVTWGVEF